MPDTHINFDNQDAFETILKALEPLGFIDSSWSNDACPSVGKFTDDGDVIVRVWVDYKDPNLREFELAEPLAVINSEGRPIYEGASVEDVITEATRLAT